MARPTLRVADSENSHQVSEQEETSQKRTSLPASLRDYALLGAAATLLLGAIEWIDLSFQLTPVFESFSERLVFTSYFSLNLLVGACIGLLVGLSAYAATGLNHLARRKLSKQGEVKASHNLAAGFAVAALAAILLNQQPQIHGYAIALLREAEKFPRLARPLLAAEYFLSYVVVMGLAVACSIVWMLARNSARWSPLIRLAWAVALLVIIGAAYYVDSRVEVQQYEYSMHRSMFLLDMTLAMALIGSLHVARKRAAIKSPFRKFAAIATLVVVAAAVVFTFARFDKDQNLKTQVFYRTTQTKQHFKLAQWALDFDRDGYSRVLGGGDTDDSDPGINPGVVETLGDGIDNNSIGGDLTEQEVSDWQRQFDLLHAAPNPSPRRLNLIYFFIDTLRHDHLGAYGYSRNTSPNIDKLAARSSVFENGFSPSPYTYEAAPKFMQSAYWDGHFETWTEVMARNGYKTILFPRRLSMLLRHVKGMDEIVDVARKGLKQTIDGAIDVLGRAAADQPFCAYIYASDPHRPYRHHEGINYGPSLVDQYDGEIAYLDYHLGRLFDWMEKSGRMNDTMVVIMSDHGESFGERMVYKHNSQLYDEQMRVPMIFYVPGQAPRRIPDYVSTVDLGTTILNLVGLDSPEESAGVSLLPLMRGEAFEHPPVYGEHVIADQSPYVGPEKAAYPETRKFMVVTQDGYKLIYNRNFYNFELFNLKDDPKENRNLYDRMPEKAAEMKLLLGRFADIVAVKRPWDADELKFYFGIGADDDEGQK
ncbi:MAG TPA: sulfatase [Blastocatellia bacterium]|nr:sulfatase [Blastocatellia bacterium]